VVSRLVDGGKMGYCTGVYRAYCGRGLVSIALIERGGILLDPAHFQIASRCSTKAEGPIEKGMILMHGR